MPTAPTVIWTVLPKSFDEQGLRFSVYTSFRLDASSPNLSGFSLSDWPAYVAGLAAGGGFLAEIAALGAVVPATLDTTPLRSDVWQALFPPTMSVQAHAFQDHAQRPLRSYPAHVIHDFLEAFYATVGNGSSDQFPILNAPGPLNSLVTELGHLRNAASDIQNQWRAGPHPDQEAEAYFQGQSSTGVPLVEFYNAWRFYNRGNQEPYMSQQGPVIPEKVPEPLQPPSFDFHQIMAAIGDHPQLMRMLGIVLDFTVDPAKLGLEYGQDEIRLQLAANPSSNQTPWTRFVLDDLGFRAAARPGTDQNAGLLQLGNPDFFRVVQLDVDGQTLKTLDFTSNMLAVLNKLDSASPPQPESLPAERNGGLTVLRCHRDYALEAQFGKQAQLNSDLNNEVVFGDDVTRGFRVDIKLDGKWHSLCQRQSGYLIVNGSSLPPIQAAPDEGYVKAATATSDPVHDSSLPPDMYLHEAAFGWDNWSLVVPRPGKSISYLRDDKARTQTLVVQNEPNLPHPDFPIQFQLAVTPGTLPRMRFGQTYAVRARVVDLAGNGLPARPDDYAVPGTVSPEHEYLRYEPVPPPVLVMREPIGLAESVEHLVIRTKVNTGPIDGVDESAEFNTHCRRFVAPAKASQILAELHGAFDPLWATPHKAYQVAVKEAGTFNDPTLPGVQLIDITGKQVAFPPGFKRGDPLPSAHHYTIQTVSKLQLPYLPDPAATGWVLRDFPGQPLFVQPFGNTASWPDYEPLSLVLSSAGSSPPKLGAHTSGSEVQLPPGTMVSVRMSSAIETAHLNLMARFRALSSSAQAEVLANANQHWMTTPWREVKFVHAVEKPLAAPEVHSKMQVVRQRGDTFAELSGFFQTAHPQSTGLIELRATWTDWEDNLRDPEPRTVERDGSVFEREHGYDEQNAPFPKYANTEPPKHEFGDTKHRVMNYYARATTRYREYFSPALYNQIDKISVTGPAIQKIVPSSARPDVPHVLYVVPTFRWEESSNGQSRTRVGRGLRIYLDRPWYSSGEGERLAVVLEPPNSNQQKIEKYVSEWGRDPVFTSSTPNSTLKASDFLPVTGAPDEIKTATGLRLAELEPADPANYDPNLTVDVVAFAPSYNVERRLHFVDIELDDDQSYYPFVRLALARYQEHSIGHLHLSRVVRAEFAQLTADRSASFNYVSGGVFVTVHGIAVRNQFGEGLPIPIDPTPLKSPKSAAGPSAQPQAIGGPIPGGPTPPLGYVEDARAGAGRLLQVHVERLDNQGSEDFGWVQVGSIVTLPSFKHALSSSDHVYWRGNVPLPSGVGTDGMQYRLVIQEFELFETDAPLAENVPIYNPQNIPLRKRLVYTDVFALDP